MSKIDTDDLNALPERFRLDTETLASASTHAEIGDVVTLKTGSPKMTVTDRAINPHTGIECADRLVVSFYDVERKEFVSMVAHYSAFIKHEH